MIEQTSIIQKIAISIIPLLFAITLHEAAHAWVANKRGDKTAYSLGRVSLNPLVHIDPVGTIIMPILLLTLGSPFLFGWAKPVPVNWRNLKNPRNDKIWVALAGPLANLVMAFLWAGVIKLTHSFAPPVAANTETFSILQFILLTSIFGLQINILLMILNLLPIPPLDGSRVIASLLPPKMAYQYEKIEPFGLFILVALLATGLLSRIMGPSFKFMLVSIISLLGLH